MEKISRLEAAYSGKTRYFTGKKCRRGHVAERYTSSGQCCICAIEAATKRVKEIRQTLFESQVKNIMDEAYK